MASVAQNPPLPTKPQEKKDSNELKPVIEFQELAPSPNATYFHLAVYPYKPTRIARKPSVKRQKPDEKSLILKRDQMKQGCVVVRDWPRKRMSQVWTRDSMVNPNETTISFQEFIDGELDSQLISVFGKNRYNQVLEVVKQEREKQKQTE
jgi:hypothetical protein